MFGHYVMLVNPAARDGLTLQRLQLALLTAPDIADAIEIREVRNMEETGDVVAAMDDDTIPVAVGGDGTINVLARVVREVRAGRPIGIMPMGTGNAVAHGMGVGTLGRALDALRFPEVRSMDVFDTTHPDIPLALISVSVGGESTLLKEMSQLQTWQRVIGAIKGTVEGVTRDFSETTVTLDGRTMLSPDESFFNAGLYNHRTYAFGREIFPGNDPGDGEGLCVTWIKPPLYFKTYLQGLQPDADPDGDPRFRPWKKAHIDTTLPVQFDGEFAGEGGSFEVTVAPGAIRVIVPQPIVKRE
jgi:diacylglycerol kinase family enzyme